MKEPGQNYGADRLLAQFVAEAATARGVGCEAMSQNWLLRLQRDDAIRWVVGYQFDLNTAGANSVAQDKVATYLALQRANIPVVQHVLVRSMPPEPVDVDHLRTLFSGPFIIKPLNASGGRGVQLVGDPSQAAQIIQHSDIAAWAASPFCDIVAEYRVMLLDNILLLAYQKTQPVTLNGLRYFNLGLGAVPRDIADPQRQQDVVAMAQTACREMSLRLAAVDVVQLASGDLQVLEVNDGIMMENYARMSQEYSNRAAGVYDTIVAAMFTTA
jgi:glutathione synthase/RimK-type ligase-like ATP-grasp enzyme